MNRVEYEQQVLEGLRKYLLDPGRRANPREGGLEQRIVVEEVRLDASSTGPGTIVVLYRDLKRPECLFGWRREALEPALPKEKPNTLGPEIWTTIVSANFAEYVLGTPYGLPEDCYSDRINWTQ